MSGQNGKIPSDDVRWHALASEDALATLDSQRDGLSRQEATRRLEKFGPNTLPEPPRPNPFLRFLAQFNSALIYLLLAGATAAALLGHGVDAVVILLVVLVNAIVGFVQEGKAEGALAAVGSLVAHHAFVRRDGMRQKLLFSDLVPGDIVLIEAGDRIAADLRLIQANNLTIDEALLTGESLTAEKTTAPVAGNSALGDRSNMAFSGTLVTSGRGAGVVVATATHTEIGRISGLIANVEPMTTPLLRQIDSFARRFTLIVGICAVLLFFFAVLVRNFAWDEALISVVALAVGVVPEGLPAVITITLAIGVRRMLGRKAVVRKLPAVETLGATSVICTDKTGTLTRNEMTVRRVETSGYRLGVSGTGYAPAGELTAEDTVDREAALASAMPIIRCGLLCNDSTLREENGQWMATGDPMEAALVALAMKAGLDPATEHAEWERVDEIPFDAEWRYMAVLVRNRAGEHAIAIKGAPEALLAMANADDTARVEARIATAASCGERVLGFALRRLDSAQEQLSRTDLAQGIEFLGIMGFMDPPRPETRDAIARCRSAGIDVKMITGDHVETALAIARQLHLADDPHAMTGVEIDDISDGELARIAPGISVFARTSPEHKLRIVRALQANGAIVAMTGDGVNDAPSLKQADVGTAMGIKGTEAAREAAQMVLLDDNFTSIVDAVHEGRTVYDNIRKVITWTVPSNGGEALAVIAAILVGFSLPMTATQILWVNLILSATLGLALAFEPSEDGVMQRPPRDPKQSILSPFMLWRVIIVSILLGGASLGVFFFTLGQGHDEAMARTMVVNTLVAAEIFYLFNVRYLHVSSFSWKGAIGTPEVLAAIAVVLVGQTLFNYAPFMQRIFDSRPLSFQQLALVVAVSITLMVVLELEKLLLRRLRWFSELGS